MKLIDRYVINEFLKPLVFSSLAFGGLVMISEFFRELSFYLEKKTSFLVVAAYLFCNLPWWIIQVLPVAVLLAVLFSLSALSRHNEIIAIKAAGLNIGRLFVVFILLGLIIGGLEIFFRENVVPAAIKQAERIRQERIHGERAPSRAEYIHLVVALPQNARMTIGYLNIQQNIMRQVIIDYYDNQFRLRSQIVATTATWNGSAWILAGGVQRFYTPTGIRETAFASRRLALSFSPREFVVTRTRPEQMTSAEFKTFIAQLKSLGISVEKERIQYNLRWSSVVSHVVVMLIGIPFALSVGRRQGKFVSFTLALVVASVYWGVQAVGQSLGENRVISPVLAAWLGNIVFTFVGGALMLRVQK